MSTKDIKETTVTETENTNTEETVNNNEKPVDGEETNIVNNETTEEKGLLEDMEEPNESRDRLISTIILCGLCAILTAIITTLVVSSHNTTKEMDTEVKYKVGTEDSNVFIEQAMYNIANDLEMIEEFTFYEKYSSQVGTNTPLEKVFNGTLVQKPNIVERYGYVVDDYDVQYSEDAKNFKNSDETDLLQVMFNEESIQNIRKIAAGYEVEVKSIIDNKPFEGSYTLISDNENTIGRIVGNLHYYAKSPETDYSIPGGNKDVSEDYYIELITNKYKEIYNTELPSADVTKTVDNAEEQTDEQSEVTESEITESEVDADEHTVVGTLHITDREYIGGY